MSQPETMILAAVTPEVAPLKRPLGLRRAGRRGEPGITYTGRHDGRPIIVAVTGIGPRRAEEVARRLLARHAPRRVLIVGFAGGTRPDHRVGDVITPAEVIDEPTGRRLRPTLDHETGGTLLTSDRLITDPGAKAACFERFAADAVDMETAAIAAAAEEHGVGWLCIRAISDTADAELPPFLLDLTRPDGRPNLPAALRHALTHPQYIAPLIRLGRDTRTAANALARRLLPLL